MKRIIALITLALFLFNAVSCGKKKPEKETPDHTENTSTAATETVTSSEGSETVYELPFVPS